MNKNLNTFYGEVLTSIGATTDKAGYTSIITNEGLVPLSSAGKRLVLPYPDQLGDTTELVDGKVKVTKIIYNPLNEDVIKGDSSSLTRTKDLATIKLGNSIAIAGALLLRVAANEKLQAKTPMTVNKFLGTLKDVGKPNRKRIVDDKSVALWDKLYPLSIQSTNPNMVTIFIKKVGLHDKVKYNRLTTIKYNWLKELPLDGGDMFGVKLRDVDSRIFRLILNYIVGDGTGKTVVGSNDTISPGFISMYTAYLTIINKCNRIIKSLRYVDEELYDNGIVKTGIKVNDLDDLSSLAPELNMLPSELDANRATHTPPPVMVTGAPSVTVVPGNQGAVNTPTRELTIEEKILYGDNVNVITSNTAGVGQGSFWNKPPQPTVAPVALPVQNQMNNIPMFNNQVGMSTLPVQNQMNNIPMFNNQNSINNGTPGNNNGGYTIKYN